ncbi:MAG: hypothetical protein K5900_03395 [Butyrivibrio sp.]|jgi:hypothetical protein|nr:hypothetical protein [Butyrivibrio sp.]
MEKRDISDIKESETFVVTIQHSQNSTWQGEVTWVTGENEKIHFRSGLELIKIMNEAISKNS